MSSPNDPRAFRLSGLLLRLLFWSVAGAGLPLYFFAREVMNPGAATLVGWHLAGGLLFSLVWLVLRFRTDSLGLPATRSTRLLTGICVASGVVLVAYAASGNSVGRIGGVFIAHVAVGIVIGLWGVVLLIRVVAARMRRPARLARAPVAATMILISGAAFGAYSYSADAYYRALTATNGRQAGNPLFPAGTRAEGAWNGVASSESCVASGCHPEIGKQWDASGHSKAASNPAYERALLHAQQSLGAEGVRWCQGCHSPTALITSSTKQPAVDCLSCHAMSHVQSSAGNGRAVYAATPQYPFGQAESAAGRWLHGFLLRVRPAPHRAALYGPTKGIGSEGCAPCHRLGVNMPQNHYKFLRYDNTWADWQGSPFSGESLHTFTTLPRRDCVSCHMPATPTSQGKERTFDHSCPGGSAGTTALAKALRVEVFALRHDFGKQGVRERVDVPLASVPASLQPGETVALDVLVENRGIGHAFPSGVPDVRDAWLSLTVTDASGKVLFVSDQSEPIENRKSKIENGPHRYGLLALDRSGKPTDRGNLYDMVATVYNRSVPAGEGEVARYRFTVPPKVSSLLISARLRYARYGPSFLRAVGEAAADGSSAQTLGEHTVTVAVGRPPARVDQRPGARALAEQLSTYGAALLNQGDRARARQVFQQAMALEPANAEHVTGLARCYLAEGDLLAARDQLQKALSLSPSTLRAKAWLGTTLRYMGQLDAALKELEPLVKQFPRDRLLWSDIGWCHYQSLRYEAAAEAFSKMIEIDPDDPGAHYNLMLCYNGMRKVADARREEVIFHTLQDDEPTTRILDPYLNAHPWIRREALPMHEHVLEPLR